MIDSSPRSAESSFRELDDVFLQTQTRIWLGEVLNTRLDEDLHISDLLQDGEILFEVSKALWNLLLAKCMELRHLKSKYRPFGSKKSSGRYRPYSNVDSFLKLCKIMGLNGIDLFSPSDVVEKRNIRKVCICVRALSKKARSKLLSVPDYDIVERSITMPKNMVGVIRKSLESSQHTLSSSSSYSHKGSQVKSKEKNLSNVSNKDDDSSLEESDEAESRYMGENSFSSFSKFDEYADGVSHANSVERHNDVSNSNSTLKNDDSIVGDSSCVNAGESDYISNYLAFSDLMVHATNDGSPVIVDGEKNMFDFFLNDEKKSLSQSNDEEMEVSSTTSMSSVVGRLLSLEFDQEHFDEDESSSTNVCSSVSKEHEIHEEHDSFSISYLPEGETCGAQTTNQENDFYKEEPNVVSEEDDISHATENSSDKGKEHSVCVGTECISDGTKRISPQLPPGKRSRKPLLTTVAKGTAIAGVLFLLLHIRKSKANNAQETKPDPPILKPKGSNSSSPKQQTVSVAKGIYPAGKLKLGF